MVPAPPHSSIVFFCYWFLLKKEKKKKKLGFAGDVGSVYFGPNHPMKPHRLCMTHHLVLSYDLHKKMEIYVSFSSPYTSLFYFDCSCWCACDSPAAPQGVPGGACAVPFGRLCWVSPPDYTGQAAFVLQWISKMYAISVDVVMYLLCDVCLGCSCSELAQQNVCSCYELGNKMLVKPCWDMCLRLLGWPLIVYLITGLVSFTNQSLLNGLVSFTSQSLLNFELFNTYWLPFCEFML